MDKEKKNRMVVKAMMQARCNRQVTTVKVSPEHLRKAMVKQAEASGAKGRFKRRQ